MSVDPTRPHTYPRRILVVVTGMSPQVVTETLYALAVERKSAFVPTEIRVVTTGKGADIARRTLLNRGEGWFHKLRSDYQLPAIDFDAQRIHTLADADGVELDDIQSPADNTATADAITQLLCELTGDDSSALHVSIAGGRKTMGFYLGYALSLYGRAQDRLSHVLVNPPYESHPEFFYPTPTPTMVKTRDGDFVDARDARVGLAEIPFVRLRDDLPQDLLEGRISFHDAVEAAQPLGPVELVIDLRGKRVSAGGRVFSLEPVQLAFLAWMARRQQRELPWLAVSMTSKVVARRQQKDQAHPVMDDDEWVLDFLEVYKDVVGPMGTYERTADPLLSKDKEKQVKFFDQKKSRLEKELIRKLGKRNAEPYLIAAQGKRPMTTYRLDIPASSIRFEAIAPPAP